MKDNIISFILTLLILVVIICTICLSLDLCHIIELPEKFSLRTYLSDSVAVSGDGEDVIYYPDYDATGYQNLTDENVNNEVDNSIYETNTSIQDNSNELSKFIHLDTENNVNENNNNNTYQYNNITDNSYYYNQLNDYGKTIYSTLYSNLDNLKSGSYTVDFGKTFNELLQNSDGERILGDSFQLSINAMLLDHPEIFYLDVTKMYMFTEATTTLRGTTYKISIGPENENANYLSYGFNSKSDVISAEKEIKSILYGIKSELTGDIYDQIKYVHDYLVDNVTYDSLTETDIAHGIYGALINRFAVCDGYSKAFKYILDNIGISCVEVCGIGENSSGNVESHAWNYVLIDGNWYAMDVTWDDPIINGGTGILTDSLKYNYFLKGADTFFNSHTEDGFIVENGEFSYPELNQTAY